MEPTFRHPLFDEAARRLETALQASPVHHRAYQTFSDLIPRTPGGRPTGQQVMAALEAAGLVAKEFLKADGARRRPAACSSSMRRTRFRGGG